MKFGTLVMVSPGVGGDAYRPEALWAALPPAFRLERCLLPDSPTMRLWWEAGSRAEADRVLAEALRAAVGTAHMESSRVQWMSYRRGALLLQRRRGAWRTLAPHEHGGPASVREPRSPGPRGFPPAAAENDLP